MLIKIKRLNKIKITAAGWTLPARGDNDTVARVVP